jgi:hypothetical protein
MATRSVDDPGMRRTLLIVLLVIAGTPASSFAQAPFFDPISMDRFTPDTTIGVDFGFEVFDEPGNSDLSVIGVTLGGHFVSRATGFGGYVTLPLSYVSVEDLFGVNNKSDLMLGNIEGGGMFAKWLGPETALVFHGGFALPTADNDALLAGLQDLANSPRYADFVLRDPNSTWLRLGLSPMGRSGNFLWRADVGIDLALDDDNANEFQYSPVLHLSLGGGIDLGSAVLMAELVNLLIDSPGDDSSSTLSLGARFGTGNVSPGIALILPLGEDVVEVDEEFAIAASLAIRL